MSDDTFNVNYVQGMSAFEAARRRAFWKEIIGLFRGQSTELLCFDDIKTRLRLREESYRGLQNVPLSKIVGSVGRYRDFTADFLPRRSTSGERWSRVYAQINSMEGVPPIELYKIGDVYFVRDGNHRVSVARQLGSETIEAHVTELPTTVHLEPGMSAEELDAVAAYAAFLEESGLQHARPQHQSLQLSETSRYHELLGHIYLHQSLLEHIRGYSVPLEDASGDWYDNVYRPAVSLIRKYGILDRKSDRTEADLFLWMVDHLREVREEFGDDTRVRSFSHALVDFLTEHHIPIPKELLMEDDDSVILTRTQVMNAVKVGKEREKRARKDDQSD
jgi:hypothetical protein